MIVIFTDTVSREQFHNLLPKTRKFFKNYAEFESDNYKEEKRDKKVFEFMRFHSLDKWTWNNVYVLNHNTT